MGLYRGNGLGFSLLFGSLFLAVLVTALLDLATTTAIFLIGGLMIGLDLIVRWHSKNASGWRKLFSGKVGGQFVFLPVWGAGILFLLIGYSELQ
ncbi:hypothetical protein [Candidatus Leptofilum sp.]|uniref:hypothetical protein n=1 Tax=Candidatus Leptofilum sp. TaxID=3241576 RepID=UPI003B5B2AB4